MTEEIIQIIIALITIVGSAIASYNFISRKVEKERDDREKAISRIYGRFDQYKDWFEEHYVRKDICKEKHEYSRNEIKDLKDKLYAS